MIKKMRGLVNEIKNGMSKDDFIAKLNELELEVTPQALFIYDGIVGNNDFAKKFVEKIASCQYNLDECDSVMVDVFNHYMDKTANSLDSGIWNNQELL